MRLFKKYYIYILELIIGNIIFNFVYAIIKTLTFQSIGATNETCFESFKVSFTENFKISFVETFVVYIIIYVIAVIAQILYDKSIVNNLNNKLNKTKERG